MADVVISEMNEVDPKKKDFLWAVNAITSIRSYWKRYADPEQMRINKEFLFSKNSLKKIEDQYSDVDFKKNCSIENMGLLASTLDTLIEELTKDPPKTEVKALDPQAMSDKKKDLLLLKNRPIIQADLSALQSQIGLPAYKFKNKNAKTNVDDFDDMDLDERDPEDVRFFKDYHRPINEIAMQSLINNVMLASRFDQEILRKMVVDIMAARRICMQTYVDKITGQIKYRYIYPETAWHLPTGDSYDSHDDMAKGWQDSITVNEFLQMAGNEFEYDMDWKKLLAAINNSSSKKYTGLERRGVIYSCMGDAALKTEVGVPSNASELNISWSECLSCKVSAGYIEWKTWEITSTTIHRQSDYAAVDVLPYTETYDDRYEVKEYYKSPNYQQQWYSAFFVETGTATQSVFNFSKVYYQQFEGANDEYSSGTLQYYREVGTPAVEMVKSDVEMIHEAYYKMRFLIYKSKPADDVYVWEELIAQSKLYKKTAGTASGTNTALTVEGIIEQIIKVERAKTVKIRAYPEIDGKKVTQLPPLEGKRNGIDPLAGMMQAIVQWGEERLKRKILGNGLRLGDNPQAREALQSEQNSVDASKNTTNYIYRMIQFTKERAATATCLYAQDIINFEDSLPYKYIQNMLGATTFNGLLDMKGFAAHRYGIFIRDYNTELAKSDLRQAATMSFQQEKITWDEYFMISQTEDFKEASRKYALARYKNEKKLRKQQLQDQQIAQQTQAQAFQQQMALLQFERETVMMGKDKDNLGLIRGKQIDAQSKVDVKGMTINSEPAKQQAKAAADESLEYTKANIEQSKPYQF